MRCGQQLQYCPSSHWIHSFMITPQRQLLPLLSPSLLCAMPFSITSPQAKFIGAPPLQHGCLSFLITTQAKWYRLYESFTFLYENYIRKIASTLSPPSSPPASSSSSCYVRPQAYCRYFLSLLRREKLLSAVCARISVYVIYQCVCLRGREDARLYIMVKLSSVSQIAIVMQWVSQIS